MFIDYSKDLIQLLRIVRKEKQKISVILISENFLAYFKHYCTKEIKREGNTFFGITVEVGTLFSENTFEIIYKDNNNAYSYNLRHT